MPRPKFRTGFETEVDPETGELVSLNDLVSQETGLACKDPSLAVQSEKEQADINVIVARALATGQAPQHVSGLLTGDLTEIPSDLQGMFALVDEARASFLSIRPDIRQKFGNDPVEFARFVSDPANLEECRKLGLAVPAPEAPAAPPPPAP